jgi:S-adenosylmethionine-diacylglycerol 3-amino-3-carboxypropyl transferase
MITFLKQQPNHSYDRFVFLDAQDWMSDEVLNTLWVEVLRVGKPNSRIVFRTAAVDSPLETALKPDIKARIHYEKELSTQLFQQDRSAIYGGFHVYHTLN